MSCPIYVIYKARQQQLSNNPAKPARPGFGSLSSFTLIELMAVVLVILVLAATVIGIANSIRQRLDRSQTQADIAGLSVAIESYKNDAGAYPTSSLIRSSWLAPGSGKESWSTAEINNSGLLVAQLTTNGHKYYNFRKSQTNVMLSASVPTNSIPYWPSATNTVVIRDRWGSPLNYYCTYPVRPTATYAQVGVGGSWQLVYCIGGQMNVNSFDLWSYGPDTFTYLPVSGVNGDWNQPSYATDDITNWKR